MMMLSELIAMIMLMSLICDAV